MGMDLLPYIVLLVVPILGRMSDQNEAVRLMATHCFATLIRLMPLEVRFSVCFYHNEVFLPHGHTLLRLIPLEVGFSISSKLSNVARFFVTHFLFTKIFHI